MPKKVRVCFAHTNWEFLGCLNSGASSPPQVLSPIAYLSLPACGQRLTAEDVVKWQVSVTTEVLLWTANRNQLLNLSKS